jgi:hypothetical protein
MDQISPFIASGLDDVVGPRTRIGAVKLAGAAFSKLGREAMEPLLQSLRPAVRNLLLQKFEELEKSPSDEPEIEDVPEVEVTVAQPRAPATAKPPVGRPATGGKPPLGRPATGGKSAGMSIKKPSHLGKPPAPKPPQSDTGPIKAPATPKAPNGPSPRQKRLSPNSEKIFTPSSPTMIPSRNSSFERVPIDPKWTSSMCAEEEDIMDQILEETGLVFGNGEKLTVGLDEEIDNLGLGGVAISCC